jgi:bla regulator protein BlaR1
MIFVVICRNISHLYMFKLDSEDTDGNLKVYTIASFGAFGFENGIFTKISGSGAIPTVITFSKSEKGEYSLLEYKEPMSGDGYHQSKKDMFPQRLWDKVLSEQEYYPDLAKQQEEQAKQYLQSIGRNAEVSAAPVERKLTKNVEASNKLFGEFTKYDAEFNNFPYWIGTKEIVTVGVRYIYETSQSKTSDGYDLITFKKTKDDGTLVIEYQYKIVGNEPQLISQNIISST